MNLNRFRESMWCKYMAAFIAVNFTINLGFPTIAFALTSGPAQPEFSSFEPVATTNMVNEFSGDFTYNLPVLNIPGPNGAGYAMSLSYHGGTTPEEEASWVGYGWTLNPGAINRSKRGYPDDWKGEQVKFWNKTRPSRTVSIGGSIGLEIFSFDLPVNMNASLSYNNYKGFGYSAGVGVTVGSTVSLGYNVSDGEGSFSLSVNPAGALSKLKDKKKKSDDSEKKKSSEEKQDEYKKDDKEREKGSRSLRSKDTKGGTRLGSIDLVGSNYGIFSYSGANRSTNISEYKGNNFRLTATILATLTPLQAGPGFNLFGTYVSQTNLPENSAEGLDAYGYMYSKEGQAQPEGMMDYYIEKGTTYNKRDKFLGIPFNNVDNYSLTGEGLGGGFRMYSREIGHFKPNKKNSKTHFFELGVEIELPLNFGGGADAGYGQHNLDVEEWQSLTDFSQEGDANVDEPHFFRFNNDLGGYVLYGSPEKQRANISYTNSTPGWKSATASVSHIENELSGLQPNDKGRSSRSSYIGYNTFKTIKAEKENGVNYGAYDKGDWIDDLVDRENDAAIEDQLGEFSIVNEDGQRYNYGLPVYSRKEKNLSVDLVGVGGGDIYNNYLAYRDVNSGSIKTKVGEESDPPYATAYLLTSITNDDYIDRTYDGPTQDDFGGWTKFVYKQAYGSNSGTSKNAGSNWYNWRIPFNGLLYERGSLSDPHDDLGSFTSGEKEVYYLDSIITKTHVAVFETSLRTDAKGAEGDVSLASANISAGTASTQTLQQLDAIKLYAKRANGTLELIRITRFDYDYVPFPGAPNAASGKLNLKKVWFEYNGVYNAKISPYEFDYVYPTVTYPTEYAALDNYGSGLVENPAYDKFSLDPWGNYQANGAARFNQMKNWVDQSGTTTTFDPAAWQLKTVKLPSGGEIHVQYEQDEYGYVQDKLAHGMISLKPSSNDLTNKYYINYQDMGITTAELPILKKLIKKHYIDADKKMYFKFLYKLIGPNVPQLSDCNADYLTGYVNVRDVEISGSDIYVKLGKVGGVYDLPYLVCRDFVKTQRAGMLSLAGDCNADEAGIDGTGPEDIIMNFVGFLTSFSFPAATCMRVNFELSYLRLPLVKAKKGGGLRVKRLLMYDKGIETGYPELYGNEYNYDIYDPERGLTISSGVATNEPGSIREENVLVEFMDRFKQSMASKLISGRDKKQTEGPLGESILPGPSVGYSKVTVSNIHKGKTTTGFSVKEFFTAKDYPVSYEMTDLDNSHKDFLPIPGGLVNKFTNNLWASQGFVFKQNSMHGQLKTDAAYGGTPDDSRLVSLTENSYFEPGENIPVMYDLGQTGSEPLGQEMDLAFESRAVKDVYDAGNVEFDVDGGIFLFVVIPFASAFPSLTFTETEMYTHTTSKIVRYPVIQKSTKAFQDGVYHITENLYFNPQTGKPVVTKTYDGFDDLVLLSNAHDGSYTSYSFPASREYPSFDQKALNERKVIQDGNVDISLAIIDGEHYLTFEATGSGSVGDICDLMGDFTAGDLIELSNGNIYHMGDMTGEGLKLHKVHFQTSYSTSTSITSATIVRSGKSNRLLEEVGSFTTYGASSLSTTTTPIPSSVMTPRQTFASLLTSNITSGATITPGMLPSGLELVYDQSGTCGPLPSDHYIKIEGNNVNVYQVGTGAPSISVVGTPSSPHPMVNALNNYLSTYRTHQLTPFTPGGKFYECTKADMHPSSETLHKFTVPNSETSVSNMRNLQTTDLAASFSSVNGTTHSIDDFFEDYGKDVKNSTDVIRYTSGGSPVPYSVNQEVILRQIGTTKHFGLNVMCDPRNQLMRIAEGCSDIDTNFLEFSLSINYMTTPSSWYGQFIETTDGYLGFQSESGTCMTNIRFYRITGKQDKLVCSNELVMLNGPGHFEVDNQTAGLVYYADGNPCYAQSLHCLQFCEEHYPATSIADVVASSANTMSDLWPYSDNNYYPGNDPDANVYETGERGKWRTTSKFSFNTEVTNAKNYNSGIYDLDLFNWQLLAANVPARWLKATTVTAYSPHGSALEENNILGIRSAAKFGYHKTLPYVMAQNSDYSSVFFESFESRYNSGGLYYFEDGFEDQSSKGMVNYTTYHSGKASYELKRDHTGITLLELDESSDIYKQGALAKVWIKTDMLFPDAIHDDELLKGELRNLDGTLVHAEPFKKVARVGEWSLYEMQLKDIDSYGSLNSTFRFDVFYTYTEYGTEKVWIDDLRLQPLSAQMTTYVYDPNNQRLITSFDDQHFGMYYQYNAEGKLVRKLIETEKGVKTLQEAQYNTPLKNR
jgi:hypothetical protein